MKTTLPICLLLLLLFSCKENKKEDITRLVMEWQGKEIRFPSNPVFTLYGKDTVPYNTSPVSHRILVFVDSLGCTSCKLQLASWKPFIDQIDSLTGQSVPILFYFQSKNIRDIRHLLLQDSFDQPVCIDTADELNRLNHFPSDITFQTFLLDKENKVEVIGNPIHNLAVKDLYLTQITGNTNKTVGRIQTEVSVDMSGLNMGTFPVSETREAMFTLTNIGNQPLVIVDATTTCGCATPTYDKHPALPGETLQVKIIMSPKESGFFSETITIRCNTSMLIKGTIKGQAQ